MMELPLPQTLFGRLFGAIIAVVAITLLIIVLLIVRERRELAQLDSSTGASAQNIVELSQYLAGLPPPQRPSAQAQLREQARQQTDEVHPPHAAPHMPPYHESPFELARAFAAKIQKQLGNRYDVSIGPPRAALSQVIALAGPRDVALPPDAPGEGPRRGMRPPPGERLFDITVRLPDGDRVIFRARAPRPGPHLPVQIFVDLGVLTAALGVVLYLMTRTITRPLAELERAADAVGRGTTQLRLEERGAREIRGATRAFNAMQDRLRRYLDSRTRVLAAMSHDLRTPLTRLRLRVESIEDDDLRQRCAADLDEMADMVRGALSFFRGLNDEEPPADVDINALLQEIQHQYGEVGGQVDVVGEAMSPCRGKPLALKRCIGNLVDNAIRHGKRATIIVQQDENLVIRVCDEGPGIPDDQLEQVFEPFYRLESSRSRDTGGTGLGLSIARDIAQAHGGSLTLRNRHEGGLEALLTLPVHG
jgi:signal transduction histidine kinase